MSAAIKRAYRLAATKRCGAPRLMALALVLLTAMAADVAHAAEKTTPLNLQHQALHSAGHYFIDFHGRHGPNIVGHLFMVYGRLNDRGQVAEAQVVGLMPKHYLKGPFPVAGSIGPNKFDLTIRSAAVYRRYLSAAQFHQASEAIRRVKTLQPTYHLIFFNCNDLAGEVAEAIGLRRPPSLMLPVHYVTWLRAFNEP